MTTNLFWIGLEDLFGPLGAKVKLFFYPFYSLEPTGGHFFVLKWRRISKISSFHAFKLEDIDIAVTVRPLVGIPKNNENQIYTRLPRSYKYHAE